MIKAIKKGFFVLRGSGDIIKSYGYIYGLIDSLLFVMEKSDKIITYNYSETSMLKLNELVDVIKSELGFTSVTFKMPIFFLNTSYMRYGRT